VGVPLWTEFLQPHCRGFPWPSRIISAGREPRPPAPAAGCGRPTAGLTAWPAPASS